MKNDNYPLSGLSESAAHGSGKRRQSRRRSLRCFRTASGGSEDLLLLSRRGVRDLFQSKLITFYWDKSCEKPMQDLITFSGIAGATSGREVIALVVAAEDFWNDMVDRVGRVKAAVLALIGGFVKDLFSKLGAYHVDNYGTLSTAFQPFFTTHCGRRIKIV